jgi:hypothetical protein
MKAEPRSRDERATLISMCECKEKKANRRNAVHKVVREKEEDQVLKDLPGHPVRKALQVLRVHRAGPSVWIPGLQCSWV